MYLVFKDKGLIFREPLAMTFGRWSQTTGEALTASDSRVREISLDQIHNSPDKGEIELFTGTDFLSSAVLMECEKNACWYFWAILPRSTHLVKNWTPSIVEKMSSNTCQLREGKVKG
ncbi:hypothetical protein TNIN_24581 [Trichonephila inaurata madagascariensis]|uniref:Uncharacterized protein n=1 Tax=Trichonephila inaurata madagascariensis TaxID=2747483 RepID=A0A8X7BSN9_9ARAC|nr:hypothetical protein TNIN_24581 [Trichonephila inaurata madagascariensis]